MSEPSRKFAQRAIQRLVTPVAKFYFRAGLGYGDYESAAKRAFLAAAIQLARARGEDKPTQAHIAAVTGFTLPEVSRLMKAREDHSAPRHDRRARAARVLDGLWEDPDFLDALRRPLPLKVRGPVPSVVTAVKRYAGTQRARPILRELLLGKAMRRLKNGRYKAVKRSCTSVPGDKVSFDLMTQDVGGHLSAGFENLDFAGEERHLIRSVLSAELDPDEANKVLFPRLRDSGQVFIEGATETLAHPRYKPKGGKRDRKMMRIRVSIQVTRELGSEPARSADAAAVTPSGPRGKTRSRAKLRSSEGGVD